MAEPANRRRRRLSTVAARTALALLLLCQLGVLWVVAHPSPTRLPAGIVGLLGDLASGPADFNCREATVDRRGRVRLGGARISDSLNPGDAFEGDIDVLPDWRGLCLGQPGVLALQVRGRATLGPSGDSSLADDIVVRLGEGVLQVAARAGSMVLRADISGRGGRQAEPATEGAGPAWDRDLASLTLRTLRAMNGAVGVVSADGRITLDGGFVENPAAVSPLAAQAASGRLRGRWDGRLRAEVALRDIHGPGFSASHAWLTLDASLVLSAQAEGIRLDGIRGASASARGRWTPGKPLSLGLRAETAGSRAQASATMSRDAVRLQEVSARIDAADLAGLAPVAQAAREAGIDLCGQVEILGGEAEWRAGSLTRLAGSFALAETGWRDLRPALVRPEARRPTFQGDLSIDFARNTLSLTRLDLAGIRGEITGGLRAGDPFVIRLGSSAGQPVNPSCLNALLGRWWIDLWARFELSGTGTRPHADVRVEGRWGREDSVHTTVRARLERFGFMNARWLETDLWVFAHPADTLVRVDTLRGDLDGTDAGTVRGTVRWDWQRPEWEGRPQIDFEGDLSPACALRLHDPVAASKIKGWTFDRPRIQVAVGPGRPLRVRLESDGISILGGVKVGKLNLNASQSTGKVGELAIEATGELSGGKASLAITGDLGNRNQVQLSVREWSRSGAEALVAQVAGKPAPEAPKDASHLTVLYTGTFDVSAPWTTEGEGRVTLVDPSLRTVHLLGLLSEGFNALGIGFSSYPLDRAEITLRCAQGRAELNPLNIQGEDASLKLKGFINLQNGGLDLKGQLYLKDSPWGPLKFINLNRLIAKMISVRVGGTVNKPEVRAKIGADNFVK